MATLASIKAIGILRRWAITIAANIGSVYVLDFVAVVFGFGLILLVHILAPETFASGNIHYLLLFLAGTYGLWGYSLTQNLRANWRLLEETDTSTNILSKALYDLSTSFTQSRILRKFATGAGYVITEVAKEIPYYAGAFTAAAASEAITVQSSIIFLGGANLGAALYEYMVSRGTMRVLSELRKRGLLTALHSDRKYDSYAGDWVPGDYLRYYYESVHKDEEHTIRFLVDTLRRIDDVGNVLYFGCGPTVHHVFSVAPKATAIDLADYLQSNIDEIQKWREERADMHDWAPFVRFTLECEGNTDPSEADIASRMALTRSKIAGMHGEGDVTKKDPLGEQGRGQYQTVMSAYCVDAVTPDKTLWEQYMHHLASMVKPGGNLLISALLNTDEYIVNGKTFPCANIDREDMERVLGQDFTRDTIDIAEVKGLGEQEELGYTGIILAYAKKPQ